MSCAQPQAVEANTIKAAAIDFCSKSGDRLQQSIKLWNDAAGTDPVLLSNYDSFEMQVKTSQDATPDMTLAVGSGLTIVPPNEILIDVINTAKDGVNVHDLIGRNVNGNQYLWEGFFYVNQSITPNT